MKISLSFISFLLVALLYFTISILFSFEPTSSVGCAMRAGSLYRKALVYS